MSLVEGPVFDGAIKVGDVVEIAPSHLEFQSLGTGKPTHRIDITSAMFRSMLTDDEKSDAASSANTIVKKAIKAMQFDPEMIIDTTIPKFATLMDEMITDGIIDNARKVVLIQGLPVA